MFNINVQSHGDDEDDSISVKSMAMQKQTIMASNYD